MQQELKNAMKNPEIRALMREASKADRKKSERSPSGSPRKKSARESLKSKSKEPSRRVSNLVSI